MTDTKTPALEAEKQDAQHTDALLEKQELAADGTAAAAGRRGSWARFRTLSLYTCLGTYAMCLSMVGPTIPNLEVLLDTDLKRLSWAQTVKCMGNITGGILVGFIFSRVSHELTFVLMSVVCCVSMSIAPATGSVYGFIFALGGLGLTGGVYNAGGNAYIINLWEGTKWKRPSTLAFHTFFSIGATIGPLLARPFLVDVAKSTSNSTDEITTTLHNETGETLMNLASGNRSLEDLDNNPGDVTMVIYAYVTAGLVALLGGIMFLFVHLKQGGTILKRSERKTPLNRHGEVTGSTGGAKHCSCQCQLFHLLILIGLFLSLFFTVICLHVPGSLLASFVVEELHWSVADGSTLTAVYYGTFCLGRLIGLPISLVLSPTTILLCGMSVTTGGHVLMLFVCHLQPVYMYLSVAIVGIGMSSTIGALYVWASNHIVLSGRETGILQCGFGMGEMGAQPLTAYLFETYTPMWLIYISIGVSSLSLIVFTSMQVMVTCCCRKRQSDRSQVI